MKFVLKVVLAESKGFYTFGLGLGLDGVWCVEKILGQKAHILWLILWKPWKPQQILCNQCSQQITCPGPTCCGWNFWPDGGSRGKFSESPLLCLVVQHVTPCFSRMYCHLQILYYTIVYFHTKNKIYHDTMLISVHDNWNQQLVSLAQTGTENS